MRKYLAAVLAVPFLLLSLAVSAASQEAEGVPGAIEDVAWLEGYWVTEAFGGEVEEIWLPPAGGAMLFTFRAVKDNEVMFYELGRIAERDGTLTYSLKHFNADLEGWEPQEAAKEYPLVSLGERTVRFDGFVFSLTPDDQLSVVVEDESGDETKNLNFLFSRKQ